MTAVEPCENCGTPVVAAALEPSPAPVPGWRPVRLPAGLSTSAVHTFDDASTATALYEGRRGEDRLPGSLVPTVAYHWFEHTPARCQASRRQEPHR